LNWASLNSYWDIIDNLVRRFISDNQNGANQLYALYGKEAVDEILYEYFENELMKYFTYEAVKFNAYNYVSNNPLVYIDPNGLSAATAADFEEKFGPQLTPPPPSVFKPGGDEVTDFVYKKIYKRAKGGLGIYGAILDAIIKLFKECDK